MKKCSLAIAIVFALLIVAGHVPAQEVSLEAERERVARETMPEGAVQWIKPVWGKFAESASPDKSERGVVLYRSPADSNSYEGTVLVPEDFEIWNGYVLPKPKNVWSMMSPIAVLFANVDGDSDTELLIIDECYTGIGPTGARPFYRSRVYDFNGVGFEHRDDLSEKIGNLNTAAKVRAKLRQMGASLRNYKTPMFEMSDIAELNQKIREGSEAGESWIKDPMQILFRAVGSFSDALTRTIEMKVPFADGSDTMTAIVTDEGLADDSVDGMRYRLDLSRDDKGVWSLVSAGKAWKCQPNRGSQVYSTARCL